MPCNCTGYRVDKCSCALVPCEHSGVMVLANVGAKKEFCHQSTTSNIFLKILEHLYEKCAAYNLRYCPLRELAKNKGIVTATLKDVAVLVCFLLANFVVFLALLTKITVHLSYAFAKSAQWLKRLAFQEYGKSRRNEIASVQLGHQQ